MKKSSNISSPENENRCHLKSRYIDTLADHSANKETSLSYSSLKQFDRSPSHFLQYKRRLFKETPAMRLGTLTHMSILEPDLYKRNVIVTDLSRRTKAFKEFESENFDFDVITPTESKQIRSMTESVKENKFAHQLISECTELEQSKKWEYRGHHFRGIPDGIGEGYILDLKTTKDASPHKFGSDSFRMLYHMQAALYMAGLRELGYNIKSYYIVAVESAAPHPVSVFKFTSDILDRGHLKLDTLIDRFDAWDGSESGYHPDQDFVYLDAPNWSK